MKKMIFRVRQFCCALSTFVRLVAIFFLVFHLLLALSAAIWYTLFSSNKSNQEISAASSQEIDDQTFDTWNNGNGSLNLVIVTVLGIFSALGILVNVLLLIGIKLDRRTLFLPWLVFHLITVMGCFAGGIYVALWFTILKDKAKTEEKVLAVLAIFPIVGGIFLIFLWILVDQLYIQMGVKKNETVRVPGSTALSRKNSNVMVIDHSLSYANSYATLPRPGKILGVGELERRHQMGSAPTHRRRVQRTKSTASQYTLPRRMAVSNERRPRIDAFQHQQNQRARSLEHILDQDQSRNSGPNYWVANGATLASRPRKPPRQQRAPSVENMLDESSLETNSTSIPSYCTVDRRMNPGGHYLRNNKRIPISSDESSDGRPAPLAQRRIYKVNSFQRPPTTTSSSVELLLDDEVLHHPGAVNNERVMIQYDDEPENLTSTTRFNLAEDSSLQSSMLDLDLNMLPLDAKTLPEEAIRGHFQHTPRRAGPRHRSGYNTDTIRSNHSAKSVTIANQVTEFHYSEDDHSGTVGNRRTKGSDWLPEPVYPLPPPPPPMIEIDSIHRTPTPPPPTPPPPPPPQSAEKSWLSRLSPLKSRKDYRDHNENDAIVDLYYSVSDVRL